MEQTSLEIDQKQVELDMKLSMVLNEMEMLKELITVQSQTVLDYSRLLDGERSLFEGGESSLFMVNSREMNYIQSQLKLIDLMSKSYLNQLKVRHALGILFRTT
jgi:outer membrane protein TolC